MSPKVFIIIVNFNGWPDTLECLESLEKLDYDNFEVVLVDNGSKEQAPESVILSGGEAATKNLKIHFISNEKNLGFAGANNQGIKIALDQKADYILLLNNDTSVEPDFLSRLVAAAESDQSIGIAGPYIYYYDDLRSAIGDRRLQFAGGKTNWSKTKGVHIIKPVIARIPIAIGRRSNPELLRPSTGSPRPNGARDDIYQVGYITGCALMIKSEVVEKIGPLSEDYFLYYEDTDWCERAKNSGYKCAIVPESKIYHKQSKSSGEFSYPYIYYHSRNGLIFGWRFGPKIVVGLISVWIFLKQIIKIVIGYKRNWARPVMKGVMDFWRGKRGKLEGYY